MNAPLLYIFLLIGLPKGEWDAKKQKEKAKEWEWDQKIVNYINCRYRKITGLSRALVGLVRGNIEVEEILQQGPFNSHSRQKTLGKFCNFRKDTTRLQEVSRLGYYM